MAVTTIAESRNLLKMIVGDRAADIERMVRKVAAQNHVAVEPAMDIVAKTASALATVITNQVKEKFPPVGNSEKPEVKREKIPHSSTLF